MTLFHRRCGLAAGLLLALLSAAQAGETRLLIPPRLTDERLADAEAPHLVVYDSATAEAPLLLWLSGTGGRPESGPRRFYEAALQQGYRLLALSYPDTPAVSQVCTGAMLRGYEIIDELKAELSKFMTDHKFGNLRDFIGKSLPFFTTHHDLVDRQKSARDAKEAARSRSGRDAETWKGEIAKETSTLVTN